MPLLTVSLDSAPAGCMEDQYRHLDEDACMYEGSDDDGGGVGAAAEPEACPDEDRGGAAAAGAASAAMVAAQQPPSSTHASPSSTPDHQRGTRRPRAKRHDDWEVL